MKSQRWRARPRAVFVALAIALFAIAIAQVGFVSKTLIDGGIRADELGISGQIHFDEIAPVVVPGALGIVVLAAAILWNRHSRLPKGPTENQ